MLLSAMQFFIISLVLPVALGKIGKARSFQPKIVLTVEASPARKMFGSLSDPNGTPWCEGKPTIWLVGHQDFDETPLCLDAPPRRKDRKYAHRYSNETKFIRPRLAMLDVHDTMNGKGKIDRHSCTALDVNYDSKPDVICTVGADRGQGTGFTEVYLTAREPSEHNKLYKVPSGHGLQKYPTVRARLVKPLRGADGSELLFIASRGEVRSDNKTNTHRMYRNINITETNAKTANATASNLSFFFEEVPGPWDRVHTDAICLLVGDLNGDGLDDIVICNQRHNALIYLQSRDVTFMPLSMTGAKKWRQARMADVTGDGIVDLVVAGFGRIDYTTSLPSSVSIFEGMTSYPHFEWAEPYFERLMPFATPDIEVLDVNLDGNADIYIVQTDETTPGTYCGGSSFDTRKWYGYKGSYPPDSFIPPLDTANDLLLVRNTNSSEHTSMFNEVYLNFSEPGCGFYTERFGDDRTMILGQGTNSRPGHVLLLQW